MSQIVNTGTKRRSRPYRDLIPTRQGVSIKLQGNVFREANSAHARAHRVLEEFWNSYRGTDIVPTNLEYTRALRESLDAAGLSHVQQHKLFARPLVKE